MRSKELWNLEMNIQARIGGLICPRFCLKTDKFISSYSKSALNIFCSRRDPSNQKDGESNDLTVHSRLGRRKEEGQRNLLSHVQLRVKSGDMEVGNTKEDSFR
ncbi:hypothetical protein SLEP1_g17683 [Rubroshorea leprosula]|uniref:Uncharacterized protein n=1 Tax=Rubroshorea leprosula TaxID=152421 RepID=A0AAV5IV31_9ROSI|nr:hypothetical protein SLEP1_g17683 [Rubroshorea leprosula]